MSKKSSAGISAYGTQLVNPAGRSNHPVRSRYMAAALAILLGVVGANHFYLRNVVRGILMVLVTAVCIVLDVFAVFSFKFILIPVILSVLTGLSYLITSDKKFSKRNHIRIV
ncbi:MAG: TM2 domain-containing protein [Clostridia bacterium]|nr:TM2 domain-containing protein [Clostridia bacterium]